MEITTETIQFSTKGYTDIIDVTTEVQAIVNKHGFTEGNATIFAIGSTGAITVVEYEPGLVKTDLPEFFEKIAPYRSHYAHHNTWGDDNGAAHVRASLVGSSFAVPFKDGQLLLGTWQQIIFVDFDTGPRNRKVVVQVVGVK
ncbi:MAG: secondary thiamine-phosphate synthase enzyme [Flavobacteriales bacterium]|nr:MAG: secondary thiamine-phosphate synthase enzyme [Flavobacteriales bacterium]